MPLDNYTTASSAHVRSPADHLCPLSLQGYLAVVACPLKADTTFPSLMAPVLPLHSETPDSIIKQLQKGNNFSLSVKLYQN